MPASRPGRAGDAITEALVKHGLAASEYVLDLNDALHAPYDMVLPAPWSLPSRLFRSPIETCRPAPGQTRRLGLLHPELAEHPFVRRVEATLGIAIDPHGAPNEHGYSKVALAGWWHAVDLVAAGRWPDLLETARFTTPEHIMHAVAYGLSYSPHDAKRKRGHLSTSEARAIMAHLRSVPPVELLPPRAAFDRPSPCKQDKGNVHWPINTLPRLTHEEAAWAFVAAVEDGTLTYGRAGFLQWSERGRARYGAASCVP